MNKKNIEQTYELSCKTYEKWGVDVTEALSKLRHFKVSLQCWQADDVLGFEKREQSLTGGIQATGDYPGRARNPAELQSDFEKATELIPGQHKLNLHAMYGFFDKPTDRNEVAPEHFDKWIEWANRHQVGIDFNSTAFSHPKSADGFTLSHPDKKIRDFWIDHHIRCRKIASYIGQKTGQLTLNNLWIPDGMKDNPADRLGPRMRLREALDEIFKLRLPSEYHVDAVESKLFGIGLEAYTVGSHEFYLNYIATHPELIYLVDSGHYHPTENIADKISALLTFHKRMALHVTRPMRWDSDHIITYTDEIQNLAVEIVRNNALNRILVGFDFFDASVNRVAAWVIGARAFLKTMLYALLLPHKELRRLENEKNYTARLAIQEEFKTFPLGPIWDYYCVEQGVPVQDEWLAAIWKYEKEVLSKRK